MVRVLHIFGRLTRSGGAEKWVLDMFRLHDPRVRFDFLLSIADPPILQEVRQAGSTVHFVPFSRSPFPRPALNPYLAGVRRILRDFRYDVVHVHQFDLSGEILKIAAEENVPVRLMSVHATEYENSRFYRRWMHRFFGHPWILHYATSILPCSRAAGDAFDPRFSLADPKFRVQYIGFDPTPFHEAVERTDLVRKKLFREFGLPNSARVVGHVGRFARQKNHSFLVEILESLFRTENDFHAVLVGSGPLLDPIRGLVREKKLEGRIFLPGIRNDVPDMMVSLFDVFLLPSFYEGFPIVSLEAIAAGLSVLFSDRVTGELTPYFPGRTEHLPLEASPTDWGEAVRRLASRRSDPVDCLAEAETSPFSIRHSLDSLLEIYSANS